MPPRRSFLIKAPRAAAVVLSRGPLNDVLPPQLDPQRVVLGIGEGAVRHGTRGVIITHGLGSCVAAVIYDRDAQVGAMAHFQLPTSDLDPARARATPTLFGDTAVPWLLAKMQRRGATPAGARVWLVGGARVIQGVSSMDIGANNIQSARRALALASMRSNVEVVGGAVARSVLLDLTRGEVLLRVGAASWSAI